MAAHARYHSEMILSYSETDSLLSPATVASAPDYKSTATFPDVESVQHDSQVENATAGKATKDAAIVSKSYADGALVIATYGPIASEFQDLGDASWLTTSYSLAMCAVQPLTGKISDIYGRKPALLISGLSQEMWQTVMGRLVAGVGSAGMSVMVSVLIVGWRWSFIGQGPLMLFAIALVAYKLPARSFSDELIQAIDGASKLRRVDFVRGFMLTGTIAAFLGALGLEGQALPWSHPAVIGLLLGSIVHGAVFVAYEVMIVVEPIFSPALVVQRDVAVPYAINALQLDGQVGVRSFVSPTYNLLITNLEKMMYSVPLYFRVTQGSSNTTAGVHLVPAVFGNTLGGLLAGWLITRTGHYKYLLTLSTISSIYAYTTLLIAWHRNQLSLASSLSTVPGGLGMGITAACTFIALIVSVPKREIGMATAGMYLMSSIGMVVGIALCAGVQNM
ncbi:hypothetical protein DSL72_000403 [Monilinia vaccinii-corymbosi]|uniref:Major facilitator superfamily (MFS) profile domain-containing protein n=1 Tax=Monilinia vaccinii-corymbosi TaxID=61207 RepID=A0A8A3NYU8_9HELO|nr:hypothetical protein DSL72_000403 [Monilinia vaccinii-corymbosi]